MVLQTTWSNLAKGHGYTGKPNPVLRTPVVWLYDHKAVYCLDVTSYWLSMLTCKLISDSISGFPSVDLRPYCL
jgi:hypothetical protein